MRKFAYLFLFTLLTFTSLSGEAFQTVQAQENTRGYLSENLKEGNSTRKNLDICFSYDEKGNLSKITIRPNQTDMQTNLPLIIDNEVITAIIEDIFPISERGKELRTYKSFMGRNSLQSFVYEKIQIDLTIVCRSEDCGVTYAEIRLR